MLIVRDLAHFDDILTLTAGTCIFTVTIICSRTKTTEFFIEKKSASCSSIPVYSMQHL